jgi:MoaA/NifB/PqqE/SkfB family radical SAM enzyme
VTYIGAHKVFAHLDRLTGWQQGATPAPVTVEFDLSNACSLGCQSCHFAHTHVAGPWAVVQTDKPKDYSDTGKFADATLVKRALGEMYSCGVQGLVWSGGGEPTLHPRFEEIIRHAAAVGLQQGMYTLGGHITSKLADACKHMSWVVVSLDCWDGPTYAKEKRVPAARFDAACDGIKSLVGAVPTVGVSYLLHKDNWQDMGFMVALSRTLGATYTTFRPTIDTSPAKQSVCDADRSWITDALPHLEMYAAERDVECDPPRFVEYRDWQSHGYSTCCGIRFVTMVTPDGRVWVCPNRRGMPGSEIGDLRNESFSAIWAKHPRQWTDFADCRVMCRLHLLNQTLTTVQTPRAHEAFL